MVANPSQFALLSALADDALLAEAVLTASHERKAIAQLVAVIAEVDLRELYLREGCSSIFAYCTRVLLLSRHAAFRRICAARMAQKFPIILERLATGALTLSNATVLHPLVTRENYLDLLDLAVGKSTRELKAALAELRPAIAGPHTYRLQVELSRETFDQLRRLQELLTHSIPDGDVSLIFAKAVRFLLAVEEKRKTAKVAHPRPGRPATPGSRHVPAEVKRDVIERDGGRCAFVGPQGRCDERAGLELHHVIPFAAGGATTLANLELRCRAHNRYEGEVLFGRRRRTRQAAGGTRSGPSTAADKKTDTEPP